MRLGLSIIAVASTLVCLSGVADEQDHRIALDEAFPNPDTSTYFAGELTLVEHVNRLGILRLDRDGTINKYHWDLPHHFQMLPYGSVYLHGAPAELKDLPIGTHLHGEFHLGPEGEVKVKPPVSNYQASKMARPDLRSVVSEYSRVLRLEDDFSFYQRQGSGWKITAIGEELDAITVERVSLEDGSPVLPGDQVKGLTGEQVLRMDRGTTVWKGIGYGALEDLAIGQVVQLNLSWVTLLGSYKQDGLVRAIWIDEESRRVAAAQQEGRHVGHHRRRGVPAKILKTESMPGEGARGHATVQIHAGIAESLLSEFQEKGSVGVWAAEPSLRTYENDSKPASIVSVRRIENPKPGSSGVELRLHFYEMLEGFRAGRTVRMAIRGWEVPERPREERLFSNDLRIFSVGPKYVTGRDSAPPSAKPASD